MASNPNKDYHEIMNIQEGMYNTNRTPGGGQQEIYKTKDGRRAFLGADGGNYYEDPDEPGMFRNNTRFTDYVKLSASGKEDSGGDDGPKKKKPKDPGPGEIDYDNPGPGAGPNPQLLDETGIIAGYDDMMNWRPTASDGQGGTQQLNPLVDPNNWMVKINKENQRVRNMGRFIVPGLLGSKKKKGAI